MPFINFGNSSIFSGSVSASFNSVPVFVGLVTGYAVQVASNGVSGSIVVQASADNGGSGDIPTINNWSSVTTVPLIQTGSNAVSLVNVAGAYYPWVRVVYTHVSGSGIMEIIADTKGTR